MKDFLVIVKAMRDAQKRYFKTRKQDDLIESKRLEASVDLQLATLLREESDGLVQTRL